MTEEEFWEWMNTCPVSNWDVYNHLNDTVTIRFQFITEGDDD